MNDSTTIISQNAENAMNDLYKNGNLTSTLSVLDLHVLKKRFTCADVYPIVQVNLVRDQDRYSGTRSSLADAVDEELSRELRIHYTGSPSSSDLILLVRITVVSDGRSSLWYYTGAAGINGFLMGKKAGGNAKLVISYCLFCRKTGGVAVAKQLSHVEKRRSAPTKRFIFWRHGNSDQEELFVRLVKGLGLKLNKEVKFICCSRIDGWREIAEGFMYEDTDDESL